MSDATPPAPEHDGFKSRKFLTTTVTAAVVFGVSCALLLTGTIKEDMWERMAYFSASLTGALYGFQNIAERFLARK